MVITTPLISIFFRFSTTSFTHTTDAPNVSSLVCPGSLGTPAAIIIISASLQSL